jgi:tetratricopeptide (TPR) repeat protein
VDEAHEHYKKAYAILGPKENKTEDEKKLLIDMLNSWGNVYYCLGEFREFLSLFHSHKALAESMDDKARVGMFYAWLGIATYMGGMPKVAYDYLCGALELGERSGAQKVVGYACTWLTWACGYLGLFDEGIAYGKRAQEIAKSFPSDQYLFFKSLGGMCSIYSFQGNTRKVFEGAKNLLDYGERTSNSRSKVFGHWMNAWGHIARGDMVSARKESEKAISAALDPFYSLFPLGTLGMSYFFDGRFQEAEDLCVSGMDICDKRGVGLGSISCQMYLSITLIAKGNIKQGFRKLEETQEVLLKNHLKVSYAQSELILGTVYTNFVTSPSPGLATMAKNIGFILKNAPFAEKKAEQHFNKAIELFKELGAKGCLGQSFLGLGQLYKAKKRNEQARNCFLEAVHLLQECDAYVYLKQAEEELASVG